MKEIGGYFELELNCNKEYHENAIGLNLGRNAFKYILKAKNIRKVFLPYYTCDVMLKPINELGVAVDFYHIDENLEPVFDYDALSESDYFVITNYFGLKGAFIRRLGSVLSNLIVDNSQAFFEEPIPGLDCFYSPRKFFGVPDGAYLYTDTILDENLEIDQSEGRFIHLLGRIGTSAAERYRDFQGNERKLCDINIKKMSLITKRILATIAYEEAARKRKENFDYLHKYLGEKNLFKMTPAEPFVPMIYPFLTNDPNLKARLITNKIYVATYWPNVNKWVKSDAIEYKYTNYLITLPVDQRYSLNDMGIIINNI